MCLQGRLAQLCFRQAVRSCLTPSSRMQAYVRGSPGARADADAPHRSAIAVACAGTAAVSHRHPRPVASRRFLTARPSRPEVTHTRGSRPGKGVGWTPPRPPAGAHRGSSLVPSGQACHWPWGKEEGAPVCFQEMPLLPPLPRLPIRVHINNYRR